MDSSTDAKEKQNTCPNNQAFREQPLTQVLHVIDGQDKSSTHQDNVNWHRQRSIVTGHFRWLTQCGQFWKGCSRARSPFKEHRPVSCPGNVSKAKSDTNTESTHLETDTTLTSSFVHQPGHGSLTAVGDSFQQNCISKDTNMISNSNFMLPVKNSKSAALGTPENNSELSNNVDTNLSQVIKECEKRIEFLYHRLILLGNVHCISGSPPNNLPGNHVGDDQMPLPASQKAQHNHASMCAKSESTVSGCENCPIAVTTEMQLARLSEKVRSLTSQVNTIAYLSWLGVTEQPGGSKVANPGSRSPTPNPQQHLIRRSDSDTRCTIQEFKSLCNQSLTEKLRLDLRSSTFNNWPWSDAWLMRFVEQMYCDLDFITHFKLPLTRLRLWLCDVYRRYNRVPFHNYKHAFMVAQMCYSIIWTASLNTILDKEDQLALITSAICHDLDHPGFNNTYQINAGTVLAMRYNDQSPLENHHAAMTFDILSQCEANPFVNIPPATWRRVRDAIITCILATDMSRHNEILNQFNNSVLADIQSAWSIDQETGKPKWVLDKTQRDLVLMIIIKTCDISNEARPLHVAGPWINRLLAEFFHQSDYEKVSGLPVAPFMDREKVTKSASQCGFIRFVILPLFESLAKLLPSIKPTIVDSAKDQLDFYSKLQAEEEARSKSPERSGTDSATAPAPSSNGDTEDCLNKLRRCSVGPHSQTIQVTHEKHSKP